MITPVHLYFHAPCFDGIVSAVITSEYLEQVKKYPQVSLHGVNYHLRDGWLGMELSRPCAIVDFLYHPAAEFWADHHATTFLSDEARNDYARRRGPDIIYDNSASSCSVLLWKQLGAAISSPPHFSDLVRWADRIDSAYYDCVDEALASDAPALRISLALAMYPGDGFSQHLVWLFRTHNLSEVAAHPEVQRAFALGRNLQELGRRRLGESIHLTDDGIAVFDVDGEGVMINRYAAFHFYPEARYSVGVVRQGMHVKLTTMRNPWLEFPSAPLGELCVALGGGGHQRVGSVMIRDRDPKELIKTMINSLKEWELKHEQAPAVVA